VTIPTREHLLRHSIDVVECSIPDDMTIQEYRRISAPRRGRRRRLFSRSDTTQR